METIVRMKAIWRTTTSCLSFFLLWLMFSAVLGALVEALVIDLFTLGPRFLYAVITTGILTLIATSGATIWLWHQSQKERDQSTKNRLTRKQVLVILAGIGLLVASILLTDVAYREVKELMNRKAAEDSRQTFHAVSYLTDGENFDEEAVNQTLAELEDSYQNLRHEWTLPDDPSIFVHMYGDLKSYREYTGQLDAGGHASCAESGPVISLPLEKAPGASSNNSFTRTPAHEVAHALVCLSVGPEAFHAIPPWFHEGIAQRHEVQGFDRRSMRVRNRVRTWLSKDKFLTPERFCTKWFIPRDRQEKSMLYRTSLEFTRSLDAKHGAKNVNLLAADVRLGTEFNDAMLRRFGGTCESLYDEWKESF